MSDFRPSCVERQARKRKLFDEALEAFSKEKTESKRLEVEKERTARCITCRQNIIKSQRNPTTKKGACYWKAVELRTGNCSKCDKHTDKLQYDHRRDEEKIHEVLRYAYWAWHGGVDAMIKEANKCDPKCYDCHCDYEADGINHDIHNRKYATTEEMPTTTLAQKIAKYKREYLDAKMNYVNDIKMRIGCCQECSKRIVSRKDCLTFPFAHKDATTKKSSVSDLVNKSTTLKREKPFIDEEIEKCRLLCHDCHSQETRDRNK